MTNDIGKKCIKWLEKEANQNGLLYFHVEDEKHIGGYFKSNPGHRFCVFYVDVIQRIIKEKEFESEGG